MNDIRETGNFADLFISEEENPPYEYERDAINLNHGEYVVNPHENGLIITTEDRVLLAGVKHDIRLCGCVTVRFQS